LVWGVRTGRRRLEYVDGPASELLADKILDGGVDGEGNIQFALGQQA